MELELEECCIRSDNADSIIAANSFWIEGIGVILIGVPGIIGNLLSVVVLTMRSMRNVFHTLLVVLAIVDTILIALAILDYSVVRGLDLHFNFYFQAFPYLIYPTANMVLSASIFIVVAIAYERYVAVCNPYDYRATVSTQSTRKRLTKLLTPVIVVTVVINIPKYFETYTVEIPSNSSAVEEPQSVILSYNVTKLRLDPSYITLYVNWFLLFATGIIPMGMLVFLNSRIYAKILETRRLRERCRIRSSTVLALQTVKSGPNSPAVSALATPVNPAPPPPKRVSHESMSAKDFKMARVLLSIVLVFFICHLPRVTLSLIECSLASKVKRCGLTFCPPTMVMMGVPISHLMLVLNSSVNIVIYCIVGDGFRAGLRQSMRNSRSQGQAGSVPKSLGRLKSRSPSRGGGGGVGGDFLQVPGAGGVGGCGRHRSLSIGGFDETMATCSENITRASSRINVRDVDIEMVQLVLKAQAQEREAPDINPLQVHTNQE